MLKKNDFSPAPITQSKNKIIVNRPNFKFKQTIMISKQFGRRFSKYMLFFASLNEIGYLINEQRVVILYYAMIVYSQLNIKHEKN